MPSDAHPTHDFSALVAAIRQTDAALAAQASRAVNVSLMLRNWFIGHYIAEFELQGADRARYGDNLIAELARALRAHAISNRGKHQLYAYLAFYRTYPRLCGRRPHNLPKCLPPPCRTPKCGQRPHCLRQPPQWMRIASSAASPIATWSNW